MKRTVFYSSSLFFRLFIGPVPVYYDFIQSLTLKSPLDTQSRSSVKIRTFTSGNLVLWSQAQIERGHRFRRLRRPQVPDPGPPCQAAPGPKGVRSRGLGSLRSASTLLHREDVSRRKQMETFVSSTAREKSTDEARDGHE